MGLSIHLLVETSINGLIFGSLLALTAIGLSLVFGVVDVPNFAQGEYAALAGFATYSLMQTGLGLLPAAAIALALAAVAGVATEHLIIARFYGRDQYMLYSFFATFGLAFAFEEGVRHVYGTSFVKIPAPALGSINLAGVDVNALRVVTGLGAFAMLLVLYFYTRYTHTGLSMRAIADDSVGARIIGLNERRLYKITFGVGALISGTTGIFYGVLFSMSPTTGFNLTAFAFIIVVAGGLGKFFGTYAVSLLVGLFESFTATFLGSRYRLFIVFLLLFVLLAFRPNGLFGRVAE